VPWKAFKATPEANLLVLDVPVDVLDAAPQFRPSKAETRAAARKDETKVNDFWQKYVSG
jgi:hypothetical protein